MQRKKKDELNSRLLLFLAAVSIVVSTVSLLTVLSAVEQVEGSSVIDTGVAEASVQLSVVGQSEPVASGGIMTGQVVLNIVENKNKRVI